MILAFRRENKIRTFVLFLQSGNPYMTLMRSLYIDMNSFFASVEQQEDPALRGKPVGITAISAESGACVAASYEAKSFGVKTGTRVFEARRMCPDIVFRSSRHRLYVRVNQKIAAVVDELAELEAIRSVDEFQVALGGQTAELAAALDLGRQIKAAIRSRVGSELRCSIGIGPNHLLAKIAGKLEKPDGLQWLSPDNMPDRIAHLKLDDLPGISHGIKARLSRAAIWGIPELYALDPRHARLIWGSVEGERFVRALQGMDIPLLPTVRNGYGNSKVLAPHYRPPHAAMLVGRWLIEKAVARMRRDGFCARRLSLFIRCSDDRGWSRKQSCNASQDTRLFLSIFQTLWNGLPLRSGVVILSVGVHLGDVIALADRSGELFLPMEPGRKNRDEKLAQAVDRLNRRYGQRVVTFGLQQDHPGFFEKG
ncbi:DNA polymerase Y family protein [Neptunicoccus cionae]|uniref:DNA-directed DNA polymerase n=1 Tax=Neptunicoccus cionae TaxID=2035344 RepID=A0A916R453_9RHOB|nr:UMUC-like DNA-repair protein [Amylibacter cionae]GGA32563.1 DNA polymerase IV [Amylibacter cionae]